MGGSGEVSLGSARRRFRVQCSELTSWGMVGCAVYVCALSKAVTVRVVLAHTRSVEKVSDLWSTKIQLFIWMSETLIPFKVVFLVMHTLFPAVLPLLEIFLESFFSIHV